MSEAQLPKNPATSQVVELTKQLTAALFRGDELRRRRVELDAEVEANEANVRALTNMLTGIELGKRVEAERAADAAAKAPA